MAKKVDVMHVEVANNMRLLVARVNELKIQKEQIVAMEKVGDQFMLVYYILDK